MPDDRLVLASLDVESLANVYQTNSALRSLVERYLEIHKQRRVVKESSTAHDYGLPGADKALVKAAREGKVYVVQFTLLAGADVHARDDQALIVASLAGHVDIVRVLLSAGAIVHADDDQPLRDASQKRYTEIVRLLLEAGADVHALKNQALSAALVYGHADVVRLLLVALHRREDAELCSAGADVHANADDALRAASREGHTDVEQLFLNRVQRATLASGDFVVRHRCRRQLHEAPHRREDAELRSAGGDRQVLKDKS